MTSALGSVEDALPPRGNTHVLEHGPATGMSKEVQFLINDASFQILSSKPSRSSSLIIRCDVDGHARRS